MIYHNATITILTSLDEQTISAYSSAVRCHIGAFKAQIFFIISNACSKTNVSSHQ